MERRRRARQRRSVLPNADAVVELLEVLLPEAAPWQALHEVASRGLIQSAQLLQQRIGNGEVQQLHEVGVRLKIQKGHVVPALLRGAAVEAGGIDGMRLGVEHVAAGVQEALPAGSVHDVASGGVEAVQEVVRVEQQIEVLGGFGQEEGFHAILKAVGCHVKNLRREKKKRFLKCRFIPRS